MSQHNARLDDLLMLPTVDVQRWNERAISIGCFRRTLVMKSWAPGVQMHSGAMPSSNEEAAVKMNVYEPVRAANLFD